MSKIAKYFASLGKLSEEKNTKKNTYIEPTAVLDLGRLGKLTRLEYQRVCENLVYLFKQEKLLIKDLIAKYNISIYQYQIIYRARLTKSSTSALESILPLVKYDFNTLKTKSLKREAEKTNPRKPHHFTINNLHDNPSGEKLIYNRIITLMIERDVPYMGRDSLATHLGYANDSYYIYFVLIAKNNKAYKLSINHLIKIAQYLNVRIEDLVKDSDEEIKYESV